MLLSSLIQLTLHPKYKKNPTENLLVKIECQKDFSSQIQSDKIIFFNPSRTKRFNQLEENQIAKKHNEKFIIYDYYNDKLVIFKNDIKELNLNSLINCN